MMAPTVIPKKVAMIKEEAPDVGRHRWRIRSSLAARRRRSRRNHQWLLAPPPRRSPFQPSASASAATSGSARCFVRIQPIYPPIAKTAHVSGTVILHAIIAKDGTVQELQYVSGPPLLMRSAMDAVQQWRYQPTQLNGEPVEVDTTISVVFTLGG